MKFIGFFLDLRIVFNHVESHGCRPISFCFKKLLSCPWGLNYSLTLEFRINMTLSATLVGLGRGTNPLSISNWPLVAFAFIAIQREQKKESEILI
jgi:hypothetical protein